MARLRLLVVDVALNIVVVDAVVAVREARSVLHINVTDLGNVSVEDTGDLLESWAASLDVHEVDPDEFQEDPAGVDGEELPVLAVPCTTLGDGDGVDVVVDGKRNLNSQIHDEETLARSLKGRTSTVWATSKPDHASA